MMLYDVFYFKPAGQQSRSFDRDCPLPSSGPKGFLMKCVCTNGDGRTVWLDASGRRIEAPTWSR